MLSATEYVTPAIEIIDARIEQFDRETKAMRKVFDTISDFAANAGIVLGGRPVRPIDVDLRWVGALLYKNGVIEETGLAAGVLNHPATGVAWLANKIAPYDEQLNAGDVVLAGSFTRPTRGQGRRQLPRRLRPARRRSRSASSEGHAMQTPVNPFKQALHEGRPQIGLWVGLADAVCDRGDGRRRLRLAADRRRARAQRSAHRCSASCRRWRAYPTHPIVRPVIGDVPLIKQLLDVGTQTLLMPIVETAEQAATLVARDALSAARHPRRGLGARALVALEPDTATTCTRPTSRCACWCRSRRGRASRTSAAIAATEGVDGVFFGPADLSASMGLLGQPAHPKVQRPSSTA